MMKMNNMHTRKPNYSDLDQLTSIVNATRTNPLYKDFWADVDKKQATPKPQKTTVSEAIEEKTETLEQIQAELNGYVGLDNIKKDIASLINFIKIYQRRLQVKLKVPDISWHMVFTGSPGTGKTTIARLMGRIFKVLGILPKGHLVEVDRSALVAGYVGQTASKTKDVIQSAIGGVLFIDEAYSLSNSKSENDFGKEAIDILLKEMEDHRKDLVVIVAGYDELMENFINSNPGLRSRFNRYFKFPDYTNEQLLAIFDKVCTDSSYKITDEARAVLSEELKKTVNFSTFGNARGMRNLFEKAVMRQADRLATIDHELTVEELMNLIPADIMGLVV